MTYSEQRKFERADALNFLAYSCVDEKNEENKQQGLGRTLNISEGGVLLETDTPLDSTHTILLTIALGFGFFTIDDFFAQHLAHKTAFSIISWFVYGSLLIGHYKFGWRGQKAIRFTLIGFMLLAIGFIGSKFVLEMVLGR